jgi:glucose-1-phosphate adenylyltransferase
MRADSSHDFGKDILPRLVAQGKSVFAYPFEGYWVDVGTVESYWKAHMDLLASPPPIDLNDRTWIVHTRTEERPPVWIERGAVIQDSMITDGCEVAAGARVERSVLGPGVKVRPGAVVRESVILTDAVIEAGAVVEHAIIDKKVYIGEKARVGAARPEPAVTMIGKNGRVGPETVIEPGVIIGPDVVESDYKDTTVREGAYLQTKREPFEV